jgi:Zn-finger nucleic acid-binding protein
MICPVCKEPMVVLELDQVEIDYCTSCGGIWLDSGELELLMEDGKDDLKKLFTEDSVHTEKHYKCPICNKRMLKVHVGDPASQEALPGRDKKEILIDRCRNSHGIWFDKGELKSVVMLSSKGKENKVTNLLKEMFESKLSNNNSGENK